MGAEVRTKAYKDLVAWQVAMDLVPQVYRLCTSFPSHERFGLTSQVQRAAVSIAANIAEGQARESNRQFAYHLRVASGSLAELDTLLIIAVKLHYVPAIETSQLEPPIVRLRRLLSGLLRKLEAQGLRSPVPRPPSPVHP